MPTIPTMPENTGGAGIGSRNRAKRNPTTIPVASANKLSFIVENSLVVLSYVVYFGQKKALYSNF